MPRLTDTAYLHTRHELHTAWVSNRASFALLSASEQWNLYGYYCIEHVLSDERLLAYRREVTKVDAGLPQRAGRAVTAWRAKLPKLEAYRNRPHVPPSKHRKRNSTIRIFAAVQPELDPERMARALFAAFTYHEAAMKTKTRKRRR